MSQVEDLSAIVSQFGAEAKRKLANIAALGSPEDQLRAPLETLVKALGELCGQPNAIVPVGETKVSHLSTRPDYSVTRGNELIGFIELKAPGKGADPRHFTDDHDKKQWEKLKNLPNLI